MPSRCARGPRERDERGVSAVLVAIFAALTMVAAAFAVDLGMQRVLRRDLQAVADLVALDLARELTGAPVGDYSSAERAAIDDAEAASLARNDDALGGAVDPADVDWEFVVAVGDLDEGDAVEWVVAGPGDVPDAIRVHVHSAVEMPFGGITGVAEGEATRSAVASAPRVACLEVGSYAASLAAGDAWLLRALLDDVLGPALASRVMDPDGGLAGVDVLLLDLVTALDALVPADVSALSFARSADATVGLHTLLHAVTDVLQQDGAIAEAELLRDVDQRAVTALGDVGVDVSLAGLVELDSAGDAAAELQLDTLDVVAGALALARPATPIGLPDVDLPLPLGPDGSTPVALRASVELDQTPVVQCEGRVETSEVRIDLSGGVLDADLGDISVRTPVGIEMTLPDASAAVRGVRCVPEGKRVRLTVDSGLLDVDVRLGQPLDDPGSPPLTVSLGDVGVEEWNGVEVATGTVVLATSASRDRPVRQDDLLIADEDYDVSVPLGVEAPLPGLVTQERTLTLRPDLQPLDDLLAALRAPTLIAWVRERVDTELIAPLLGTMDDWLLAPLDGDLGIDVDRGSVSARPTVACGSPKLTG